MFLENGDAQRKYFDTNAGATRNNGLLCLRHSHPLVAAG
jgi:hypothetical protein